MNERNETETLAALTHPRREAKDPSDHRCEECGSDELDYGPTPDTLYCELDGRVQGRPLTLAEEAKLNALVSLELDALHKHWDNLPSHNPYESLGPRETDACGKGHEFTPENTGWRSRETNGKKRRFCKHCASTGHKSWRTRRQHAEAEKKRKTHCTRGHAFSQENTGWKPRKNGRAQRFCRACANAASSEAHKRRRRAVREERKKTA